ncbi:hypothetical protein H0O00_02425 [Candidatus Micrarchaeota archaeon]|nr:hypothetical protein [Candidatus Micrarchaeota archaeon]
MLAAKNERDQQRPKGLDKPISTAFVVAVTLKGKFPDPEMPTRVEEKARIYAKANTIAAMSDPKSQRDAWNSLKAECAGMKPASEPLRT